MFTSKSANREKTAVSLSLIGPGTIITGNLESAGDIRIDGVLKGNLHCQSKILIGPDGQVIRKFAFATPVGEISAQISSIISER